MPSSVDNYYIRIDSDNNDASREFRIEHDLGGAGKELLKVGENGVVTLYGPLERSAPHVVANVGSGDIVAFQSNGVFRGRITAGGTGHFVNGVRLVVDTSAPSSAGAAGDIRVFNDSGTWKLAVYMTAGTAGWKFSVP